MMRLFVGLELSAPTAGALAGLCAGLPGARWVPQRNLHLTLCFVGAVAEPGAEDLHHQLAGLDAPAFRMAVAGFGLFGDSRKARTLWAGIDAPAELAALAARVQAAVRRAGIDPEGRKFTPHVTLARLAEAEPGRIQAWMAAQPAFRLDGQTVDHFSLFQSRLYADGPEYEVLERYPLG